MVWVLRLPLQLVAHGCALIMRGNQTERAEAAATSLPTRHPGSDSEIGYVDLGDLDSVADCANELVERGRPIDLLVNNAGVMMLPYATTTQGFERHFGINHLGHFALTGHLLPLLVKAPGSRV